MDFVLQVVLIAAVSWLAWKTLNAIRRYKMIRDIFKSGKLETLGEVHPIMGHIHLVSTCHF